MVKRLGMSGGRLIGFNIISLKPIKNKNKKTEKNRKKQNKVKTKPPKKIKTRRGNRVGARKVGAGWGAGWGRVGGDRGQLEIRIQIYWEQPNEFSAKGRVGELT